MSFTLMSPEFSKAISNLIGSSIVGIVAGPGNGIYAATKFAIRGLSESLRCDLAPYSIDAVLCPGTMATNLDQREDHRSVRYMGAGDDAVEENRALKGQIFIEVLPTGMDPLAVGGKVLQGICKNYF